MGKLSLERLWVLMVTAFVDMVGFALVLPLLPLYAKRFGADASTIGLLLGSFALAQLVTSPFWGRLSDRSGRRPVIVGGQALAAVAYLIFAGADSVWLLLFSRLAQGAGGGTISVVQAYVSDVVNPDERAKALGWITASSSFGVMIGPAIGSLSLTWIGSHAAPGLIAAGLCVLNILFAWRWLPESTSSESRQVAAGGRRRPLRRSLLEVLAHPLRAVHALIWLYTSGMLGFFASASIIALYLSDRYGIVEEEIGWFYVAIGFVSVVMRALILGPAVKHLGEVRVLRLGILTLLVGLLVAPLTLHPWTFLAATLFIPAGTAFLFPSTTSLISRYADRGEVGQMHGVQQAFGGTSRMLAPILAGFLYDLRPPSPELMGGGALPFWLSAAVLCGTGFLSFRIQPGGAPPGTVPDSSPGDPVPG